MHLPRSFALLPFLALLASARAVPRTQDEPIPVIGPEAVELAQASVKVPFELARSRPVPVVEARINGRGPYRFFFDTGASGCVLDTSLVQELELVSLGTTEIGDPSQNERIRADKVRLAELTLGGLCARGVPAVAFERGALDRGDGVRGVLGLSLFTRHLFTLDYGASAILVRAGELERGAPHVIDFELDGVPRIVVDVAGTLLEATLDSGSPAGIALPHGVAQTLSFREPLVLFGRARTVNSEFAIHGGRLDGAVALAGHVLEDPYVTTNELFEHVNLGYEVLRSFALTFDLARRRVAFERQGEGALALARPAPAAGPRPAPGGERRRLGAELASEPAGLRLVAVVPGTEAERAGLRAGDLVLSIDGAALAGQGHELLARALATSDPIAIRIERAGTAEELVLFPRP